MTLRDDITDALLAPNVRAFLRVIRAGESSLLQWWRGQRAFKWPILEPGVHRAFTHPNFARPLRSGQGATVERNEARCAPVVVLVNRRSPPAIVWAVAGVIVDAIERQPGRWRPHVFSESRRIVPSSADINPSTAVAMVSTALDVVAAIHHPGPHRKPRCSAAPMMRRERAQLFGGHLAAQAPARSDEAKQEMLRGLRRARSAIACAAPSRLAALLAKALNGYQAAESPTAQV